MYLICMGLFVIHEHVLLVVIIAWQIFISLYLKEHIFYDLAPWVGTCDTVQLLSVSRLDNSVLDHCHYMLAPFQDMF